MDKVLQDKWNRLKEYLLELGSVAVAFSGGVDSTFLLKAAHDVLGDGAVAITAVSRLFPDRERGFSQEFCRKEGIRHYTLEHRDLEIPGFAQNPKDRCYLCKKELMRGLKSLAREQGIQNVAEGSNLDDLGDYRPGMRAVEEEGIKSPLRYAGMTKQDIRELSRELKLPTWDKPSFACLASRFVYGDRITEEKLSMVDQAEQFLLNLGFGQMRVRIHGNMARIEVLPEDFPKLMEESVRTQILEAFRRFGFSYITADLEGYRTGSMNEVLSGQEKKAEGGIPET